ncbi:MAG TPA: 5-guanidino-2-oxopentanoate decarboxylase [Pseudomonadota bacterium]|nr:5-guanidino-2-oxopentanoate decarboxylase [Pseudomonadota bacterium]
MSKLAEPSTGEALVGLLEAYGVDTIFGIPGDHNDELYRALPRSRIRHLLARHEQGAGFMADGYARATGRPGVCFTISGPGLTNILTPVGQAWSDSSPLLVISSALDTADSARGRGRLHEMLDQRGAAAAVTSLHLRAATPKDVREGIARAFAHFASERPRPAYLEIPLGVLKQPAGDGWTARGLPGRAAPAAAPIRQAVAKLTRAKRPLIVLGGGALGAGAAAVAIAEKLKAPIITTTAGKGAVPADHPLCLGYVLGHAAAWRMLAESDAILCAGSELAGTDFWNDDILISHDLIRVDIDPLVMSRPHPAEIAIVADAREALVVIAAGVAARGGDGRATVDRGPPDALRAKLAKLLTVIRAALPPETVICSDMTQLAYAANEVFPVSHPRTWLHPVGFGALGFALPAGIGAKRGVGTTPVAVMIGDYGLQYTLSELGTAAEHKLPIVILLWNNDALGQIRDGMVSKGIEPSAVLLRNPDFQLLARAYGLSAERPRSLTALAAAIRTALLADGSTLIEMTPSLVDE